MPRSPPGESAGKIVLGFGAPDPEFLARWQDACESSRCRRCERGASRSAAAMTESGSTAAPLTGGSAPSGNCPSTTDLSEGCSAAGCARWLAQGAGASRAGGPASASSHGSFPPAAMTHMRTSMSSIRSPQTRSQARRHRTDGHRRLPANGRLRTLVSQLVQLRSSPEDPAREVWLALPSGQIEIVRLRSPNPNPSARCSSMTRSRSPGRSAPT